MSNLPKVLRWSVLAMTASLTLLFASCDVDNDNDVQPIPVSYVSLYNAIPDAPELDLAVDNRVVSPRAFEFGDNVYYQNFYTGTRTFQLSPFGADNVVADTTITLVDQNAYSVFFVDQLANAQLLVTNDSAAISKEGKAKVRLINLSPDASPVSLKVKDEVNTLTQNQAFKTYSGFIELDPGTYDFEVNSSTGEAPMTVPDLDLASGAVRTIVVRGYRNPPSGNTNAISVQVVRN